MYNLCVLRLLPLLWFDFLPCLFAIFFFFLSKMIFLDIACKCRLWWHQTFKYVFYPPQLYNFLVKLLWRSARSVRCDLFFSFLKIKRNFRFFYFCCETVASSIQLFVDWIFEKKKRKDSAIKSSQRPLHEIPIFCKRSNQIVSS